MILKLWTYPKEGNMFLPFNRLKFYIIAGYYSRACTTGGCHENSVGEGHFSCCFEIGGFTDNAGSEFLNYGNGKVLANVPNSIVSIFRTNLPDAVIVDLNEISGIHTQGNFSAFCAVEESIDNIRSFFVVKKGKHSTGVKKVVLHWHGGDRAPRLGVFLWQTRALCPCGSLQGSLPPSLYEDLRESHAAIDMGVDFHEQLFQPLAELGAVNG